MPDFPIRFGLPLLLSASVFFTSVRADDKAPDAVTVLVRNGTLELRGLLWRPSGEGPFPAVLFNHSSGKMNADSETSAVLGQAFSKHGYVCLYLYRRGAGLSADQGTNSGELMNKARAEKGQDGRNEAQLQLLDVEMSDVLAGLEFVRTQPLVDPQRIAVVGHSFGAQLSLLLAGRDPKVRAAVLFGIAASSWKSSPKLQERLLLVVRQTDCPVFFIHAENDFSIAPGRTLAAEMTKLGKPNLLKIYPAFGRNPVEGHNFVYQGIATWQTDVFAFLDERMQK
jgi:dienelactone hydrolase